jgi:hypothetical protein
VSNILRVCPMYFNVQSRHFILSMSFLLYLFVCGCDLSMLHTAVLKTVCVCVSSDTTALQDAEIQHYIICLFVLFS